MFMTDGEIITSYNQAKDQKLQISILAQLNCVSVPEMRNHMADIGLPVKPLVIREKKLSTGTVPFDEALALQLFQEGLSDDEIAVALNSSTRVVQSWRLQKGYLRSRGGSKPRKKKTKKPAPPPTPEEAAAFAPVASVVLRNVLDVVREAYPDAALYVNGKPVAGLQVRLALEPGKERKVRVELETDAAAS